MNFYNRFLKDELNKPSFWEELKDEVTLNLLIKESFEQPIAIFKHSVRCGISFNAKMLLEKDWNFEEKDIKLYYLDLIAHRSISNKVAEVFGVVHQSPQIILIKNGVAVDSTSHHAISVPKLRKMLQ